VVVLSMDAFRWDYPAIYHTPNLDRMAQLGCKAVSLKPCYPSKTFPNHYAIATGLYPDHNGIVQNNFYDPRLDRSFSVGNRASVEDSVFWEGEPIWATAEKQGIRTASFFWVGTETHAHDQPERRKFYESGFPFGQQIDTIFRWLSLPTDQRPELILFYFDEPDKTSHTYGPISTETKQVVETLDSLVGKLTQGLHRLEATKKLQIDLIILSDHGMGTIPAGQQVFLDDYVDFSLIKRTNGGNPVISIEPQPGCGDSLYNQLKSIPHLKVWKRNQLPERLHYGTHIRVPQLIVESDSAWGLEIRPKGEGKRQKGEVKYGLGMHGYDPDHADMQGIFYAMGPSFKSGFIQPAFENVNIYVLLAKLLHIHPVVTDGRLDTVKGMLKDD